MLLNGLVLEIMLLGKYYLSTDETIERVFHFVNPVNLVNLSKKELQYLSSGCGVVTAKGTEYVL